MGRLNPLTPPLGSPLFHVNCTKLPHCIILCSVQLSSRRLTVYCATLRYRLSFACWVEQLNGVVWLHIIRSQEIRSLALQTSPG